MCSLRLLISQSIISPSYLVTDLLKWYHDLQVFELSTIVLLVQNDNVIFIQSKAAVTLSVILAGVSQ
jgi:hypothetical protein